MEEAKKCIGCKGELEIGFAGNNGLLWQSGKEWVRKLNNIFSFGAKTIYSYRCKSCGLIQHYSY